MYCFRDFVLSPSRCIAPSFILYVLFRYVVRS